MDWNEISQEQNLSFAFLKENESQINWTHISMTFPLTKKLFEVFSHKLDTMICMTNPSFTLELLEEIKDIPGAIRWDIFSRYYPIDREIYERFKRDIYVDELMKNKKRTINVVEKVVTLKNGQKRITRKVKDRDILLESLGLKEWESGTVKTISGYAGKGKSRLF